MRTGQESSTAADRGTGGGGRATRGTPATGHPRTADRPRADGRPPTGRVVVAGASLGGLRAAEQLRRAGFTGELVVVGAEPHMPYNRPPLSKEVLAGRASFESVAFRPKAAAADVVWRLGTAVVSADLAAHVVRLADGEELPYASLVVATGLRPRRLDVPGPGPGSAQGRHVIRTIDDARGVREVLRPGVRLVVVGAGFVGCEVAATARGAGAEVTVVEPEPLPLRRALGELLARAVLRRHRAEGVRFVLGRTVARFTGHAGHVDGVVLDDGTPLPADLVVEAVGSSPNTEWLAGNGLDLSDGVLCDGQLRVVGAPDVVAVGDVARFPNPRYDGVARRVEHWSVPGDSAKHAARVLAGGAGGLAPFAPLPSFWSDQYAYRIQSFGAPGLGCGDVRVRYGDPGGDGDLLTGHHDADGRLVGVVALGGPAVVARAASCRAELDAAPRAVGGAAGRGRYGCADRADRADRGDRPDRADRADGVDRADSAGRADGVDRPDRADRADRPDRADRGVYADRANRADRGDGADRGDRADRPSGPLFPGALGALS